MTQATTWSVPTVGPASPTVLTQRIDDSFDALLSGHSGSSRPAYAAAGTVWEDTSVANETRLWFYDGAQDILVAVVDTTNDRVELAPQPLVDVASAATTDIGAVKSRNIRVTGTTTITSFGTIRAGTTKTVYFAAALTVTYNATSLITPTGANLLVAAGDSIDLVSLGSGNWRVLRHVPAFGVAEATSILLNGLTEASFNIPAGVRRGRVSFDGLSTNGTVTPIFQLGVAASFVTSGYAGTVATQASSPARLNASSGLPLFADVWAATISTNGYIEFTHLAGNKWMLSLFSGQDNAALKTDGSCVVTLPDTLSRVRILLSSTAFDAGNAHSNWG